MSKLLEKIITQAARYGEQVRQLEDLGLMKDRAKVRKAWKGFRIQLAGTELAVPARKSYWDSYCELKDGDLDDGAYRFLGENDEREGE